MKRTVWKSRWYDDYDVWKKEYIDFMQENSDEEDYDTEEQFNEIAFNEWVYSYMDELLYAERINLKVQTKNNLVICATLGLWDGAVNYVGKVLPTNWINDLLYADYDDVEWYCDDDDFQGRMYHHDGRNHYIYRELKDGVDEDEVRNLMYNRKFDYDAMEKYTTSVRPYIAEVYGWE